MCYFARPDPEGTVVQQKYRDDNLNRLYSVESPEGFLIYSYGYDRSGNRTGKNTGAAYTPYIPEPDSNRIASVGSAAYTYDAAGNFMGNGSAAVFRYDARGRHISYKNTAGSEYAYFINALGQRTGKISE